MSRPAVLDLGTNSTRFLCVENVSKKLRPSDVVARDMEVTRLGEGVEGTGRINGEAMGRVLSTVKKFDRTVRDRDARWVGGIATSACRRATEDSVAALFDRVESITGNRPSVIGGEREAELTFKGVQFSLGLQKGTIIDIGGGSTEWITFGDGRLESVASLAVGVVTLNERYVRGDSYTRESEVRMKHEVKSVFDRRVSGDGPLVSVGGTGTTLASIDLDLKDYQSSAVHGYTLSDEIIGRQLNEMVGKSFKEISEHPMIHPGREDVIVPGIKILQEGMKASGTSRVVVSDFGVLGGLLTEKI